MKIPIFLFLLVSFLCNPLEAMDSENESSERKKNHYITIMDLSWDPSLTSVEFVKFFPNLRELDLSGSPIGNNYKSIERLKNLEKLNIRSIGLTKVHYITSFQNLISLTISCPVIGKAVHYIAQLPRLTELDIYGDAKGLEKIGKLTNLHKLTLRGVFNSNKLYGEDVDFPSLDFLSGLTELLKLDLSSNDYIFHVKPISRLPKLKKLDLSGDKNITDLHFLKRLRKLENINLGYLNEMYIPTIKEDIKVISRIKTLRKLTVNRSLIPLKLPRDIELKHPF